MPYQKHDKDNAEVNPGTLLDRNAYERYDLNNVEASPQPSSEVESTDYGDQFRNWDVDFVARDNNGDSKYPDVPIELSTVALIDGPEDFPAGKSRVQEVLTGTAATYTGGSGTVTVQSAFACKPIELITRDLSSWTLCTELSSESTQTYTPQPSEADMVFAFITIATDSNDVTKTSISDDINVYSIHDIDVATSYSGVFKVGEVIDVTVATASGGIPNINYFLQLRTSDNGSNFSNNQTIKTNCIPGEVVQYTIPQEMEGKYIQFRTRTRDNNGQGGSNVYIQKWSIAPGAGNQTVAAVLTSDLQGATLSGEFRISQSVTVNSIPTFQGGVEPIVYEYQWQKSEQATGAGWVGFDSPWTPFDPSTVLDSAPTKILNEGSAITDKYVRLQVRATDSTGERETVAGVVYGPVVPETPVVVQRTMVVTPFVLNGAYMVGDTVRVAAAAQFVGGVQPYTSKEVFIMAPDEEVLASFTDPDNRTDMSFTLTHDQEGDYISVKTVVVDGSGIKVEDTEDLYDTHSLSGSVLPYEPALAIETKTSATGEGRPGETVTVTAATFTGGLGIIRGVLTARIYDHSNSGPADYIRQDEISDDVVFGQEYNYTIPLSDEGKYIEFVTRAMDNNKQQPRKQEGSTGGRVKIEHPALVIDEHTLSFGLPAPGAVTTAKAATITGGYGNITHRLVAQAGGQESLIAASAIPGTNYDFTVPTGWVNNQLVFKTIATDEAGGSTQSQVIRGTIVVPSTPTPNGPRYAENGYDFDMFITPNYKQGEVLRVGDTITMTVPEFFGGETPYRYDLNSWTILDKASGVEVFESPNNQPPGSSVTYTIPQSLQGKYLKVNYYFYDRLITRFKFETKLYSGSPPVSIESGIIGPAL